MNYLEYSIEEKNRMFLEKVYSFADCLLEEVLERRCNPQKHFYLPGLPVTDEELLQALSEKQNFPKAGEEVYRKWMELMKEVKTSLIGQSSPRLLQLFYMYDLDEVWSLAVILSFVLRSEPKYKKAFLILLGDSGHKEIDVFLVQALAWYLGIESGEGIAQLGAKNRRKRDLFADLSEGELKLQEYVFLWLNFQEEKTISNQGIINIYSEETDGCSIHEKAVKWCVKVAKRQIEETPEEQVVFEIQGRKGAGKTWFCRNIAQKLGYRLCVLHLNALLERPRQQWENLLNEVYFSCRVKGCLLYLDLNGCNVEQPDVISKVKEMAAEYIVLFIGTEPDSTICQKASLFTQRFSLDKLNSEDSIALWKWMESNYPLAEDIDFEQLAGKYRLLPGMIYEIFARAERYRFEKGMPCIDSEVLLSAIRECNRFSGNSLMERIDTVFTWKELRVEPQVIEGMQLACAHLKYRFAMEKVMGSKTPYGKGIGVLMYGPPGTGKTMAAQVMANELGMELYRVDLSQVTSKYIGETEKNLESVFREAEHSNVILFFDEADSLFGKRTEVKDSNDKYANQETSYILQRIESYEGMIILATNFAKNFDSAFMRRITVSIRFSEPDENMRKLLWQDMLQNTALAEDVVLIDNLAKQFELTGSNIKSIVRNALFISFMEQRELQIADVVKAIKVEFEKLGKIANLSSMGMFFTYA